MGATDKIKNAAEKAAGAAKESTGRATGDEAMQAEGRTDQQAASVKQAGENLKDVFRS